MGSMVSGVLPRCKTSLTSSLMVIGSNLRTRAVAVFDYFKQATLVLAGSSLRLVAKNGFLNPRFIVFGVKKFYRVTSLSHAYLSQRAVPARYRLSLTR